MLHIRHISGHRTPGVLLAQRREVDLRGYRQEIFAEVLVVGFVGVDGRARWQVEGEVPQLFDIAGPASGEEDLHGKACAVDHQMDLQSVEIASFRGRIAPKGVIGCLDGIEARALDADVITDRDRKAVEAEVERIGRVFPDLGQTLEQPLEDLGEAVEALVELPSAEPPGEVALFGQEGHRGLEIAAEEAGCGQGNGDDLGVGEGALGVLSVVLGLEKVIGEAIDCRYGGVHVGRLVSG